MDNENQRIAGELRKILTLSESVSDDEVIQGATGSILFEFVRFRLAWGAFLNEFKRAIGFKI